MVTSNLIFQKFFQWDAFGIYVFEISVGIIPYPVTFLVTDIISELYGKKKANRDVMAGLFASIFTLLIVWRFRKYFNLKEIGAEIGDKSDAV